METGERKGKRNFYSSGLRFPVSVLLFLAVFAVSLSAVDIKKPSASVASGVVVDVAPFGVEQLYFTVQGVYSFPGKVALSLRPSISLNGSSKMLRIPLTLNISKFIDKKRLILLSAYLGGGLELYRSAMHNVNSPLLTAGISIVTGLFFVDIPVVSALRSYNTDSDIALIAGYYFQF